MDQKINAQAAYVPPDIANMVKEWAHGANIGKSSRITALDNVFRRKEGFINGWYGWPNDGKGTMYDYLAVVECMFDPTIKYCMFKPEDMSAHRFDNKITVNANDIYNNLIWTYTGRTPYKHIAEKYHCKQLNKKEYTEAMDWVSERFFVIAPEDRKYKNILDCFRWYCEVKGITRSLIDPFRGLILDDSKRTDSMLNDLFFECKGLALSTDSIIDFIAHPKSLNDVKKSNKEDAAYKVVNQWMISGGAAWDNAMDSQYSIYRCERHLNPSDPKVHFYNLKQRKAELVGANRGQYEHIVFDFLKRRYYFDQICPITGEDKRFARSTAQGDIFDDGKARAANDAPSKEIDKDKVPF